MQILQAQSERKNIYIYLLLGDHTEQPNMFNLEHALINIS